MNSIKVSIVLPSTMEIQERILEASQKLFFQYGIRSVTMDDICRELGISKKTIYRYFKDKNSIVLTLNSRSLDEHKQAFIHIQENSKDAIHEILLSMEYMSKMFQQMNPSLFYDLQKYFPKAWLNFRNFKEQYILGIVESNLERGINETLYRNNLNTKVLARLRIEEVEMAMNPAVFAPGKFSITDVQLTLLDHFLYGIATLKGHKLINKYKEVIEE